MHVMHTVPFTHVPWEYCNLFQLFLQDCSDTLQLLSRDNIDEGKLWDYAIEAAAWSTELPKLDFAVSYAMQSCLGIEHCLVVQSL